MTELLWFLIGAVSMFVALVAVSVLIQLSRRAQAKKIVQEFMKSDQYKDLLEEFDTTWNSRD
jgi:hypothetical protein